jgi:hypothetical protein
VKTVANKADTKGLCGSGVIGLRIGPLQTNQFAEDRRLKQLDAYSFWSVSCTLYDVHTHDNVLVPLA